MNVFDNFEAAVSQSYMSVFTDQIGEETERYLSPAQKTGNLIAK
jgi:hypothetical protein